MNRLPTIRHRKWLSVDSTPHNIRTNRIKESEEEISRLMRETQSRRLSSLNNSLSPIGDRAKLEFIDAYKNISVLTQKNKINQLEDSPSVAYLEKVNKINLNPEPFGIVRRKGPETSIDIHSYSMGDVYANAFSEGINHYKDVKDLNLTNNRLSDSGCQKILQKIKKKNIKRIVLSENRLGQLSIFEIADIIEDSNNKLRWLEIENSYISDKLAAALCRSLSNNTMLFHLNLAKNNLGFFTGCALKNMLKKNQILKRLDLHWNNFRTQGAKELFEGLAENKGLKELDLSWNSLGRDSSLEVAKSLGASLKTNTDLMHLDISYNYFSKSECEALGELLKSNHTILGLHAIGNDCSIDSKGFMIPVEFVGKMQQSHFFSRIFKQADGKKVKKIKGNCWICDKWIEVNFQWIPGVSGEASIPPMYLHLEIDNYEKNLMGKQKDGSFQITRVIPPSKLGFFFSNRMGPLKSFLFKSQTLLQSLKVNAVGDVNYLNIQTFQGIECLIKDPFASKARMIGDSFQTGAIEYDRIPWNFNTSVFREYRIDTTDFLNDCFEYDWKLSKIPAFVKTPEVQEQLKEKLRASYDFVLEAYRTMSAYSGNELFCITQNILIDFLNQVKAFDNLFQISDLGINWNSANAKDKSEIYNAGNGLCRYEFMEIIVRIACDKYLRNKITTNAVEAYDKFLEENVLSYLKSYDNRIFRTQFYMTEDIDYFIKAHKILFEALFKVYSGKKANPGQKPFMSLEEFRALCADTGIISESFTTREIDVCYSQAMMTQIDIVFKKRHLEMNYVEFLEAIFRAANQTTVEDTPDASLREKMLRLVKKLLSVCPKSVTDAFVTPTEEVYFKMMYKPKVY